MRQNILYLMLPMAGMLWLAKWIHAYRNGAGYTACKFLGFAGILVAGMGILYALNAVAYSGQEWSDFRRINHYRERVGDFYTWPEYEEAKTIENTVELAVQINGKTRATVTLPIDVDKEAAIAAGKEALGGKLTGNVVKEIYVPGRIINIVAK